MQPTPSNVVLISDKIRRIQDRLGIPFLLENIATHLRLPGTLAFHEFYQQICERAECGMLLDVTNIVVNARNMSIDPFEFVARMDLSRVVQLHIVGYSECDGRVFDSHTENIQPEIFALAKEVIRRASVRAIIVERDGNFPQPAVLAEELQTLKLMLDSSVGTL